MKKSTPLAAALALLLSGSGVTLAAQPEAVGLSPAQLTQKLAAQGFTHVKALVAVHGHWEGEAFQHGEIVKFHANAQTGQVTFEKAKDNARGND
jgi:hypothetical protein